MIFGTSGQNSQLGSESLDAYHPACLGGGEQRGHGAGGEDTG